MKGTYLTTLFLVSIFFNSSIVFGQKKTDPININSIIKVSRDTIRPQLISTKASESNETQVTYTLNKSTLILKAEDLISYFDGKASYYSENIQNSNEKRLVKYIVSGPLYFGQSNSKKGEITYYLKLKEANELINLEPKKYEINRFLKEYLADFDQFRSKYKKKIFYDYKSLAEFASAYNAFKYPETYVPLKFKNSESVKLGIYASLNLSQIEFESMSKPNSLSYSVGPRLSIKYTRTISFDILSTLNRSSFEYTNEKVNINTIGLEPSIGISCYVSGKIAIKLNVGPTLHYNTKSKVHLVKENTDVLIKSLNTGLSSGIGLVYKSNYSFLINYINYPFKTENFSGAKSERTGKFNSLRFGLLYNF